RREAEGSVCPLLSPATRQPGVLMRSRAFWSVVVACACAPGAARAQPAGNPAPLSGGQYLPPYPSAGGPYIGPPSGPLSPPRVAAFGFYVPRGFWSNGLSLYGPPVPTPGA